MISSFSKGQRILLGAAVLMVLLFPSFSNTQSMASVPVNSAQFDANIMSESSTPIEAVVAIDHIPPVGTATRITCTVSSTFDAPGTTVALELPDSAEVVSGDISWQGDLYPDNPRVVSATVVFNAPGDAAVFCRALRTVSADEVWGDLAELYLNIGNNQSNLGYASANQENRIADGEMASAGDGQLLTAEDTVSSSYAPRTSTPPPIVPLAEGEIGNDFNAPPPPPGSLTVTGKWSYYDRDDVYTGAREMLVEVVRGDNGNHLAWCYTNLSGDYSCGPFTNPGGVGVRSWIHSYTSYNPNPDRLVVVNPDWGTSPSTDNTFITQTGISVFIDGTRSIGSWHVNNGASYERAYWIERDLIDTWRYVFFGTGSSQSPQETTGPATVEWKIDSTHGTHAHRGGNIHLKGADPLSDTVVGHEYGHAIMWTIYGAWMPTTYCPSPHYINSASHVNCAWTEGWANFITIAVNNDPVVRWSSVGSINLETPTWGSSSWDDGDDVEGRVAGALWDILDPTIDKFDQYDGSIVDIWETIYHQNDNRFSEYWSAWKSYGNNANKAVMSIYQNTIDYRIGGDDNYEQNDTLGTAYDLSGRELQWLSTIDGYGFQGDNDWYKIYVTSGFQRVLIDARFTDSEGDIDIRLTNSSGTILAQSTSITDNEYIDHIVPTGGTNYYILVYYGNAGNDYDLWWDDIVPPNQTLTVSKAGSGSGTVTSSPAGINCGTDCSQSYGLPVGSR